MRQIGLRSNMVFAVVAAVGIVWSLGRPWYGPSAAPTDARMEDFFNSIGRALSGSAGATGWAALQTADQLIAALAVATVALLVLALVPAMQLARWTSLATLGLVVVKLIDEPGSNALSEPRQGVLIALAAALVLVGSTMGAAGSVSSARRPRPAAGPAGLAGSRRSGRSARP